MCLFIIGQIIKSILLIYKLASGHYNYLTNYELFRWFVVKIETPLLPIGLWNLLPYSGVLGRGREVPNLPPPGFSSSFRAKRDFGSSLVVSVEARVS
jgi:hypothetical protein